MQVRAFPDLASLHQGLVVMVNGDRNTGEFRGYNEGYMTLKTDSQGDLKVKWNKILSITSDKTFEIELKDGTKIWGKLEPSDPPAS